MTAQLIRADDGVHLWSQTYDRDVKDIFQVQDEIAAAVVAALKLKLLPTQQVVDPYRSDIAEAYNQYLLGREFGRRGDLQNIERAVNAYRKATTLDPGYAVAYVGLAFAETLMANYTQDAAGFERARDAVEQALRLAPQLADAYRARASLRLETLDFAGARADGEKALTVAPGDSRVQSLYGVGLAAFGRIPEAIGAMNRAVGLDPLNSFAWANLGLFLTVNGNYPAARSALDRALAINPNDFASHLALAQLDLLEGRFKEAQTEYQEHGGEAGRRMGDAMIEHALGHERESQQALKELIAKHAEGHGLSGGRRVRLARRQGQGLRLAGPRLPAARQRLERGRLRSAARSPARRPALPGAAPETAASALRRARPLHRSRRGTARAYSVRMRC